MGRGRARRADARRRSRARAATASRRRAATDRTNGGGYTKLIANAGRHEGVEAADLIAAMTAGGLDGEAIRNVRVLERFALLEIPADAVAAIIERVTEIHGQARWRSSPSATRGGIATMSDAPR